VSFPDILSRSALLLVLLPLAACGSSQAKGQPAGRGESVYNRETGRLEQLKLDADGDGKPDTVAMLDGTLLKSIEIDRNHDGRPDRWEYYAPADRAAGSSSVNSIDRWATRVRAEESDRPDGAITRREFYENGVIQRVEEDTNLDGRMDKWEFYTNDVLTRVDLDLGGKGFPDRRLLYSADGNVERVQVDPEGDGTFVAAPAQP
jgi:hypothetical protein